MADLVILALNNIRKTGKLILAGITLTAMLTLLCVSVFADSSNNAQQRQKARHFYLKGAIESAAGHDDAAYEYYKKSYLSDPTYPEGAYAYGNDRFFIDFDTLASRTEKLKALEMSKALVDRYPGDSFNVLSYGYMALMADTAPEAIRVYRTLEKIKPSESLTQMHKANAFAMMHQTDSAISAVQKYERLEGATLETTLQKVRYRMIDQDTVGALNELSVLLNQNPKNTDYILTQGKVLQMLGMNDSALHVFKLAESIDPEDGRVKNELAQVYGELGDSVAFDDYTFQALMSDNLMLEVKLSILEQYLQRIFTDGSDTRRSDKLFVKLSEQYPHEPKVLSLQARYSFEKEDYPAAIEQMSYALDLDNRNADYFGALMSYYLMAEQPEKVLSAFEKEVLENPDKSNPKINPASILMYISANEKLERYDKALEYYDSLLSEISPALHIADSTVNMNALRTLDFYSLYKASNYFEMAGDMFYKADSIPQAFRAYENAISIFPDNELALNNYAYFLIEKGNATPGTPEFDKAKEMSSKCIRLTEQEPNPTYLDTYAWILFKDKDFDEAEKYQKRAVELADQLHDSSAELYSHYGDILFMNNKPEEALEMWSKALELEPDDTLLQKKVKHKTFFYE